MSLEERIRVWRTTDAAAARLQTRGDNETVEVRCGRQTWILTRRHLRRIKDSYPERVFREESQLVGSGHITRTPGGAWAWNISGVDAEALDSVLRFLKTGFMSARDKNREEVCSLANDWGIEVHKTRA